MAVAALVVSVVALLIATGGVWYSRRSAGAAGRSAGAAERAAGAAGDQEASGRLQAEAARAQAAGDRARLHRELTPVLSGAVRKHTFPGTPGATVHELEVRAETFLPIASLRLKLPPGSPVTPGPAGDAMSGDMVYPPLGGDATVRPGHPATWAVMVSAGASGTVAAIADCRGERGELWAGVDMPISLDGA